MEPEQDNAEHRGSTRPDTDRRGAIWDRRLRRATTVVLVLVLIPAATGLLGVRTGTTTVTGQGYRMTVTHSTVTRGGLATPLAIEVSSVDENPLPERLTIGVSAAYLRMFDDNGMEPLPVESFTTPEMTWWTFDVPPGEPVLLVELDARLEPAVQLGRGGSAELWIEGTRMVTASFSTWVLP